METVAIIPARGGSKGLLRKNHLPLAGQPLLAYSIAAARGSPKIDRVIVSTDDEEIAKVARDHGAEIPFIRPPELAADHVHSVETVLHALRWLATHEPSRTPPRVVMLLPTSPLRQAAEITAAVELFERSGAPAVVSVCVSEKQLPHFRHLGPGGVLQPVVPLATGNVQRQDLAALYVLNGSIYVSTAPTLLAHGTFHLPATVGFEMIASSSIDINHREDLDLAEFLLMKRLSAPPTCP